MAKRTSFDDKLAALKRLRGQDGPEPGDVDVVRKAIGDRSNFLVAAAAEVAGAWRLAEVAPELEAAFDRFLKDPVKTDKLCRAKLAIVEALAKQEHDRPEVFEKASKHVQMEPAFGPPVDTAPPLRATALMALTRIDPSGVGERLVDALFDPAREVRCTAASCLGAIGTEAAALVLRFKCRAGDGEPDVLSDALQGLLTISPDNLPFVQDFLNSPVETSCEAAALAMGRSRLSQALGPLLERAQTAGASILKILLLAVAMLRASAAIEALLDLVVEGSEPQALAALNALKIHKHDPKIRDRIATAAARSEIRAVQRQFAEEFQD